MKKLFMRTISLLLAAAMILPVFAVNAEGDMRAGQECIDLIKKVEGFSQYKYWDYSQWTIGYGTGVGADDYPDGITEEEAERLLRNALGTYEGYVNKFARNNDIQLKQNQFDALVSLSYNMGNIWSAYDEFDLKTYLISGSEKHSFLEIAKAFGEWRVAGGNVLQGLVSRREDETRLFLSDRTDSGAEVWRVNTESGINLRSSAGTNSEKTGFLPMNTIYEITEKKMVDGSLWGKTNADGKEQWGILDFSKYMVGGPLDYTDTGQTGKSEKWRITSKNGVNLRNGPGMAYDVLDILGYKTEFSVTSVVEADEHTWGKTTLNGKTGWVALDYAEKVSGEQFETAVLTEIYLKSKPEKTIYSEGEMLSLDGMEVIAKYSDNTEKAVTDFTVDGFSASPGEHKVVITYMEKKAEFTVKVVAKKLIGIEVTQLPVRTEYKQGEDFDPSGMIVEAIFDNKAREPVSDYTISGYDSNAGTKTIEVQYENYRDSFTVEVREKQMTHISVTRLPKKTEYVLGQQLDLSGISVFAYFDNGTQESVTAYSFDGYNPQTEGEQTITIGYNGFSDSFNVTVRKPDIAELPGDLDGNGTREVFDLVLLNRLVKECIIEFPAERMYLADINGDGKFDLMDVEALSRIVSEQ